MKMIEPRYQIVTPTLDGTELNNTMTKHAIYNQIELAARTCYKSEDLIGLGTGAKMIRSLIRRGHTAMLEHAFMSVRFSVDRGITHEMVRHRIASFAQESTRYCNYGADKFENQITYIEVERIWKEELIEKRHMTTEQFMKIYAEWIDACVDAENHYLRLLEFGAPPELARVVLNHSTKADIFVTANMREWRHILDLRAAGSTGKPHPQIKQVMVPLLRDVTTLFPELFGDIWDKFQIFENMNKTGETKGDVLK